MASPLTNHAVSAPVRQYVKTLGPAFSALAGVSDEAWVTPLGQGWNNRLYVIQTVSGEYVLKVYPAGREERASREYDALKALEHTGAVPTACLWDASAAFLDAPVLVYRKVPGRPIQGEVVTESDLERLADVVRRVHRVEPAQGTRLCVVAGPSEPRECLGYVERELKGVSAMPLDRDPRLSEAIGRLRELLRYAGLIDLKEALWRERRLRLCQVDHRLANVMKDGEGNVWLVDWEHAGLMDPAYEVASFLWHPDASALTLSHRDQFIHAYCERSEDPFCYEKIAVYLSLLPLQWAARLAALLAAGGAQPVQPWVAPVPVERLWEDLDRYLHAAADTLCVSLLR